MVFKKIENFIKSLSIWIVSPSFKGKQSNEVVQVYKQLKLYYWLGVTNYNFLVLLRRKMKYNNVTCRSL
jgi:hypothetical protein